MQKSNVFIMGTGYAVGEDRAMKAVNLALESPLLDSNDIYGTKNILLNIISGKQEITIGEIGEIIETLQERAGQEAEIIWGNGYDESLEDKISVTILATGFITNPNQTLQPKTETKKFDLTQPEKQEEIVVEKEEDFFSVQTNEEEFKLNVIEFEHQEEEYRSKPVKETVRNTSLIGRFTSSEKKKKKTGETVAESNIENWFVKKFGGIFDDEEDQPLR
jgi:cell division protein FtsZ